MQFPCTMKSHPSHNCTHDCFTSLLQISGDLDALQSALSDRGEVKEKVIGAGKCSALVKVLPENMDLFVSHDTWDEYQSMLRIYKLYDLRFKVTGYGG